MNVWTRLSLRSSVFHIDGAIRSIEMDGLHIMYAKNGFSKIIHLKRSDDRPT